MGITLPIPYSTRLVAGTDPVLVTVADPVNDDHDLEDLEGLVQSLRKLLDVTQGVGIAAPQVGASVRLILMRTVEMPGPVRVMVNPTLVGRSVEETTRPERCLSFPHVVENVARPSWVRSEYIDYPSRELYNVIFTGMDAACFCHELDHLNGLILPHYHDFEADHG